MSQVRVRRSTVLLREFWDNERYSALMRAYFAASMVLILYAPVILAIIWGAWLVGLGYTTVGAVIAVTLYAQQLRSPLDELGWWIDELQYAAVSLARIFGVAEVPADRLVTDVVPTSDDVSIDHVSFSYRESGQSYATSTSRSRRASAWRSWGHPARANPPLGVS